MQAPLLAALVMLTTPAEAELPKVHVDPAAPSARVFTAEPVRARTVAESILTLGRVERDEQGLKVVAARVSGRVTKVLVGPGTQVRAGQPIAELASQEVEAARSAAIQAESDVDAARRALEQLQFNASSVSSRDLDRARADLKRAQAQVDKTRKALSTLGVEPHAFTSLYVVRSPADGNVLDVGVSTGAEVRAGDRVARLGDPHRWTVVFQARAKDRGVQMNDTVEIAVEGHPDPLRGKIRQVGAAESSGTVQVVVAVDDPGAVLHPGLEVQVKPGHASTSEVLSIPASAILFVEGGAAVVVASGSLDLELRRVELGPIEGSTVRVISGLKPDEKVLVRGAAYARAALERK